ncbi:hypothetical protein AMAG_15925 [Allomyces macrogynus ATCC 38327]|uniref:Uncharacterized protein n=1 Tax=Allomyces macrogynus (strain ATCC 38327) TaxID=578462 RepID=A0A0L0TB31_ALLM3|nr:hypothetical protein AMAG_15925 [Allomyces macrogynus ATCC 38327]|eukprot:KNE71983.1 hypothetical protein AMAG_15925 [Allomyces macrogynus ATCC 38327]
MTKHQDLSTFIAANFLKVIVPASDPFTLIYCNELFLINAFPLMAIHNPITMCRVAMFSNLDRKSLEDCIKRCLSYLTDPDELLGELATILGDLPQFPEPREELLRLSVKLYPLTLLDDLEHLLGELMILVEELSPLPVPDKVIQLMTALDEAMNFAQATGHYVHISVHADNSSQASRTLNHRLWYSEPLQFTISTTYVLVRLDAGMEPMAKLVLNTPVTSLELHEHVQAALPYLEVMHPFEMFVAAMDASGVAGIAGHASDDAAWDLIDKSGAAT